ncbi:MAG: hypothetical protein RG740_03150 [Acholeplasmataceae bacterium]|nr:hypothetical protein [Acholeplasmataceae bacterium]
MSILMIIFGIIITGFSLFSLFLNDFLLSLFNGVQVPLYFSVGFVILFYVAITFKSAKGYKISQLLFIIGSDHDPYDESFNYSQFSFKFFYTTFIRPFVILIIEIVLFGSIWYFLLGDFLGLPGYFAIYFFTLVHGIQLLALGILKIIKDLRTSKLFDF